MVELIRRLAKSPFYTAEILVATFFITLLTLASPLFVIQVLNRYITHGFTGTLVTLTAGMLVAVALQFAFRLVRTRIANAISVKPDQQLSQRVLSFLVNSRAHPLGTMPRPKLQENINGVTVIKNAYNAAAINAVLDAPFSLIFILASFFISPLLALVAISGMVLSLMVGAGTLFLSNKSGKLLQDMTMGHRGLVQSLAANIDMVRVFQGKRFVAETWQQQASGIAEVTRKDANIKEISQSLVLTLNILMSVILYAVGAMQVVQGILTVGSLIGVNILASRAFASTTRFMQTAYLIGKAGQAMKDLEMLARIPEEPENGTAMKGYSGLLEFKDVGFAFPGSSGPLFESLNLTLPPGASMVITGFNGSGKTTMIRLIAGLLEPGRGNILADEISLRQLAPQWWRRQLCYLPQEPTFLNATIRDAILMNNPDLDNKRLTDLVSEVNLRPFLDKSAKGLDTMITENGSNLPQGIKRRIALARALATDGRILLLDEPTEGLDEEGCQAVYTLLNKMTREQRTMILVSRDQKIMKGVQFVLDLSVKPVPKLSKL